MQNMEQRQQEDRDLELEQRKTKRGRDDSIASDEEKASDGEQNTQPKKRLSIIFLLKFYFNKTNAFYHGHYN